MAIILIITIIEDKTTKGEIITNDAMVIIIRDKTIIISKGEITMSIGEVMTEPGTTRSNSLFLTLETSKISLT